MKRLGASANTWHWSVSKSTQVRLQAPYKITRFNVTVLMWDQVIAACIQAYANKMK